MDVLGEIISLNRLRNVMLCGDSFAAPWGMRFPASKRITFHHVAEGHCWVILNDGRRYEAQQGDLIVVSDGSEHMLQSDPSVLPRYIGDYGGKTLIGRDGQGLSCKLLCGAFYFEHTSGNPLLASIPRYLHLKLQDGGDADRIAALLQLITHESTRGASANKLAASWLMDTLFVYIVRHWQKQTKSKTVQGVHALIDRQIGEVLRLIHRKPSNAWTVESLAKEVGMSRAAFARRFNNLVGMPPMEYVTHWRIDLAASLLRDKGVSVASAAASVGYASEAAFGRRFQKLRGQPPGSYRSHYLRAKQSPEEPNKAAFALD